MSARKKMSLVFFLCLLGAQSLLWAKNNESPFHAGATAGLGLPKVSYTRFRSPISLAGGVCLNYRLVPRLMVQGSAQAVTSFGLGTIDNSDIDYRFDLVHGSMDFLYRLRSAFHTESFVQAGFGRYRLEQQVTEVPESVQTFGLSLGLTNYTYHKKWNSVFEIRWHVLFEPKDNPQILILSFGILS